MMKLPWTCWVPGQVLARAEKHVTLHSKDGKSFVGRADCKPQADYKSYLRWSFAATRRRRRPTWTPTPPGKGLWKRDENVTEDSDSVCDAPLEFSGWMHTLRQSWV